MCDRFFYFRAFAPQSRIGQARAVSSVGSEHCLDKAGVSGSSPLQRTLYIK